MFPESSTWRADIVRVEADGDRVPITEPWAGYRWGDLVVGRGLDRPGVRHHADAGRRQPARVPRLGARLGRRPHAARRPRPATSRRGSPTGTTTTPPRWSCCAATTRRSPRDRIGASGDDGEPGGRRRPPPWPGGPVGSRRSTSCSAGRSACAAWRCCGSWSGPWCCSTCGPSSPTRSTGASTAMRSTSRTPAWYPELPRTLYVGAAVGAARSRPWRCRSGSSPGWRRPSRSAIVAYNLFLSTTHVHNNRAYLVIVLAALAVAPCGRELSVDAWLRRRRGLPPLDPVGPGVGRCGCCASRPRWSTALPG